MNKLMDGRPPEEMDSVASGGSISARLQSSLGRPFGKC